MPTYRYRCDRCTEEFEVWQSITDTTLQTHNGTSDCGGALRKVLTPAGIVLKGKGFYKTDNRPKESSPKEPTSSSSKSSSSDSNSKSGSNDTKSSSGSSDSKSSSSTSTSG